MRFILEKDELKKRKKRAQGYFVRYNAGDVEKNVAMFNRATDTQASSPTAGLGEDLEVYDAIAYLKGNSKYPDIRGSVKFYQYENKIKISAIVEGLPDTEDKIFGFHIHSGESCTGDDEDEFKDVKKHYNPSRTQHPKHAGDLLSLISTNGHAQLEFVTSRFRLDEVIGKAIIVHLKRDDFESQPAGDAGEKIACGIIRRK